MPFNFHFSQCKHLQSFTFIYSFKVLKYDKTTFRKSWVNNIRHFFIRFSTMHNRAKQEIRASKLELCEIAHLFFSKQFSVFHETAEKFTNCIPMRWIFVFWISWKLSSSGKHHICIRHPVPMCAGSTCLSIAIKMEVIY